MRSFYLSMAMAAALVQPPSATAQSAKPALVAASASATIQPDTAVGDRVAAATLTLSAAVEIALRRHPDLLAAGRDVDIADGQALQAGARPNPQLALLSEGLRGDQRSTTIQLNQTLELGGKRAARLSAAQRERDLALADLASRAADVRADVTGAYFDALVADQRQSLAQASLALAARVADAAARRVTAGKISPLEATRAKVALASSQIDLGQAGGAAAISRQRLAAAMGDAGQPVGALAEPVDAPAPHADLPELLSHLATAPQLTRARRDVERRQAGVELERSRRMPDLTLSLGSKRDAQAGVRQTVIGLSVPLPLFDSNQGNLQSALRKADQTRDALAATTNRLTAELSDAFLRDQAARAELAILRGQVLPGAQEAYQAALKGFELGKFNFLDVLDAQRTLLLSKSQYLRALAESHRAATDMERLLGAGPQHARQLTPPSPQQDAP